MHRALAFVFALMVATAPAQARDWFVRAGAEGGDGTMAKPFADPWQPLEKCEAGDRIHIAEGEYYGRLNQGFWVIPVDDLALVGGYDAAFQVRDPWAHMTRLVWKKEFKNWPKEPRILSNQKGTVLDGLVLDGVEQNWYVDEERSGRDSVHPPGCEMVRLSMPGSAVRNCVIANPGTYGIVCKQASTIENNLIINAWGWGIQVESLPPMNDLAKVPAVVKNNTVLFCWDDRAPGKGGYAGSAIAAQAPCKIEGNILAHCDNHGIYCTAPAERVAVDGNIFHMNLFSNFKFYVEGRDMAIDNASMGDIEDVGLKSADGNEVADPGLPLDPRWMDMVSKRTAAQPGKLVMDDWNKLRHELGLPLIATGGTAASGIAPAYELAKALAFLEPKNAEVKAGARRVKLEAKFEAAAAAAPTKTYEKVNLVDWNNAPEKVDGKAIEMVVAIASVANIGGIPGQYKKDDHEGAFIYDPDGNGQRVTAFYKKGSSVARLFNESMGRYQGSGKPDRFFLVRGIAYATKWVPKGAMFVESVEKFEPVAAAAARPKGRDWFVRAGATGGKGTKEKPFKDPFQALDECEAGDTIHVAEGQYTGRLKVGTWKVDMPHIALIGGYNKDFTERDPWAHPTLLYCPADFKGRRGGTTISAGEDDTTGLIVDGFVFDKKLNNFYLENGDCDASRSDNDPSIWAPRPESVIRNCVFVNGAAAALRVANGVTVENNIFMNHITNVVGLSSGFTTSPAILRRNTFLFSWERAGRFGKGMGLNGAFVSTESNVRVVIDGNIFEFADNDAIRIAEPKDAELTDNVFAHNLWSNVYMLQGTVFVDDKDFGKICDLAWKKCGGNQILVPGVPIDETWFTTYLGRTAYVPGKVTMDDWNKLRELMGQPLIATGGEPASGLAPAYDWKKALTLFPKNEQCKAGARKRELPVKFEGIVRQEEKHDYKEVSWETAASRDEWEKLDGQRVMLTIAIKSTDNSYYLDDVKEADYLCFQVIDKDNSAGGLPLRCYVKRGTRFARVVNNAKGVVTSSRPEEKHVVKGIARKGRQLVVEVVERVD